MVKKFIKTYLPYGMNGTLYVGSTSRASNTYYAAPAASDSEGLSLYCANSSSELKAYKWNASDQFRNGFGFRPVVLINPAQIYSLEIE